MATGKMFATILLGLISLAQAIRFVMGWPVTINGFSVPIWASAIAAVVAGGIALMLWRGGRR